MPSVKNNLGKFFMGFSRFINMLVVAGAITSVVIMFVMQRNPSGTGWGFVILGGVTFVSGIFGIFSTGQGCCFSLHLFLLMISCAGLAVSFLLIFLSQTQVLDSLNNKLSLPDATQLLRVEGAIFAVLFALQLIIILLGCCVQACGCLDYYEEKEVNASPANAKRLAKQHAKEEAEAEKRRAKVEASSAHSLAEKMKAKYGAYDNNPAYSSNV